MITSQAASQVISFKGMRVKKVGDILFVFFIFNDMKPTFSLGKFGNKTAVVGKG